MENVDAIAGLRALADQTRIQVARLLVEGPFTVGEIQDVLDLGQSTVSHHLKVLSDAGLLACRREGRLAWYCWHPELTEAQLALQSFVTSHAHPLGIPERRRLQTVFDARVERTRRFFDPAAAVEELPSMVKTPAPAVDVVAAILTRLPSCTVAADLGTGSGRLLGPLRGRAKRVIGVDQSPRMLALAGKNAHEQGWHDVELRLGSMEHLPLADGELDGAVAHQVLHHVARPEAVIAEAHRALRPGGMLVVADYLPHEREGMRDEFADLWLGFAPEEATRLLENAGFVEVMVERHEGVGEELGMFVASGRRGPGGAALASREGAGRVRRGPRKSTSRSATERIRRRRTAAQGENT